MTMIFSRRATLAMLGSTLLPGFAATPPVAQSIDLPTADGRTSRVTYWTAARQRGTILFSHGALSSPAKYAPLIAPWVAAGFDVWAPLHVDSTDHPDTARYPGLTSWAARIEDMRALAAHVAVTRWVAAGHSYGGLVALTMGGASAVRPAGIDGPLGDRRVSAVVAFSPPGPAKGLIEDGYATIAVPALIETGTLDMPPGTTAPDGWKTHLTAYDAAKPGGNRYGLLLDGVDHYFGGIICRPELPGPKQQVQFDAAVGVSLDFLKAFGARDRTARAALDSRLSATPPIRLARK